MPLTDEEKGRIRAELTPLIPQLKRAAPPERARLIRQVLERVGAMPTWDEWDADAVELFGEDAPVVHSDALHP